jgi:ribosome maturation factor RimP
MDTYEGRIRELAEPLVVSEGMELIHVECLKMKSRWVIRLYMDREGGVTIEDCTEVSNQLGDLLDVHDIPPGPYTLEVSSPGLDRPLSRDVDFIKFRGSRVVVKAKEKIDGIQNFTGILDDYYDDAGGKFLVIDVSGKKYRIPRNKVARAHIKYDYGIK